jgi:DNA adenine methylase
MQPFIRWVGGKTNKISSFVHHFPPSLDGLTYVEPFLGSGSFFFYFKPEVAVISDINEKLINTYKMVRDKVDEVIATLEIHAKEDDEKGKEYFELVKSLFNKREGTKVEMAAHFIYLNKRAYNGLYRENKKGELKVSYADETRQRPRNIFIESNLRKASSMLGRHGVTILAISYESIPEMITGDAFYYIDPPYYPTSTTSSFTGYNKDNWKEGNFYRLLEFVKKIDENGDKFLLTNSCCKFTVGLFKNFNQSRYKTQRLLSCKGDKREKVSELIVTNYKMKTLLDFA